MPWWGAGAGIGEGHQEGQERGGHAGRSLHCGFHGNERMRQGQQAQDWPVGVISGLCE